MLVRAGSGLGLPLTQASRPAIRGGNGRLNNPLPGVVWTAKDEARPMCAGVGSISVPTTDHQEGPTPLRGFRTRAVALSALVAVAAGSGGMFGYAGRNGPAVYIGATGAFGLRGGFYALDRFTGACRWMLATGNTLDTSPAKLLGVTADSKLVDGVLYFGSLDGRLYAVKAS